MKDPRLEFNSAMHKSVCAFAWTIAVILALGCSAIQAGETPFAWQQDYARVTETGDIQWTPTEFQFVADGSVRYIDDEHGSDDADGASKQRPWRHHPWDAAATGKAAAATAIQTYVFKGGVIYRGQLTIKEQGRPGRPIRLTRDPSWGDGPATVAGSEVVTGWTQGAADPRIPESE
jgi:hypothetical protein